MHPRRAIIEAIRTALDTETGGLVPLFESDVTAEQAPCWQVLVQREVKGELTTKASYQRLLSFAVAAVGASPTERDELSETLEAALFGPGKLGALEVEWSEADLATPDAQVGERIYPATYICVAESFTSR